MKKWIIKQWWLAPVGVLLTGLNGLFPEAFKIAGETLKWLLARYWMHASMAVIILLLLAILYLLLKQQNPKTKNDPSPR